MPAFFGVPFFIFLLRQFYLTIPQELEDAARIDGASHFRIWWSIMLPLSKPALATVAVFTFVATYNDFFGPLIYLTDESKWTIAVALVVLPGFAAHRPADAPVDGGDRDGRRAVDPGLPVRPALLRPRHRAQRDHPMTTATIMTERNSP